MELKDVKFEDGKNYRLKVKRTIVEYRWYADPLFEVFKFKKGVAPDKGPGVTVRDLPGNIRMYAGNQDFDITVTDMDTGEVVFQSPKAPRKKK